MSGIGFAQRADDGLLRLAVHFRDEVVRRFFLEGDDVQVAARAVDDVAGAARGLDRNVEHRVHGYA